MSQKIDLSVSNEFSGVRIDKFLAENIDFLTRSMISKLIENGNVFVFDKVAQKSYKCKAGDEISVNVPKPRVLETKAENIPLDIVYEDVDLLVVNKPKGMVVHPAPGNYEGTLVNALLYHCGNSLSGINGVIRPGIVHRIDADTSGLLLVAKNDLVHNDLAKQIKEKTVKREYIALVHGIINEDSATIDAPIGRDVNNRKKMAVTADNSKDAVTHIFVLERLNNATLIKCVLETGRTHQIRVHLNYINHPIVNDPVYGLKKQENSSFGQMLHAKTIGFIHPITKEYMEFSSEVPQEFTDIVNKYRK